MIKNNMKKVIKLKESELINIIKKILNEQVIGALGSMGRAGVRIGSRIAEPPDAPDYGLDPNSALNASIEAGKCGENQVKQLINTCIKNKSKYMNMKPKVADELFKVMDGFTSPGSIYPIMEKIQNSTEFCGVVTHPNFNQNGQNFEKWLSGELTITWKGVYDKIQPKVFPNYPCSQSSNFGNKMSA